MPFLQRESTKIYYERWGTHDNHTLVLVNGFQRSSSDFRAISRKLEHLGYGVLVLDNRGSGKTETQNTFSMDDMAEDLGAVIHHTIKGKYSILGISLGGMIAQKAVIAKNVAPDSLILVSTASRINPWKLASDFEANRDESFYLRCLEQYVAPKFFKANRLLMQGMARQLFHLFNDVTKIALANYQSQALRNFDITQQLSSIQIPTLIVHGDVDQVIDVQGAAESHQNISTSTLKIFPDVGHLILAEAPGQLLNELTKFLKG